MKSTSEFSRLEAVDRYLNFHDNREPDLKDIVMLASQICNTPIAMITLMGKDIQWIRSSTGIDVRISEMPRSTSFCTHAIEVEEVMVVNDARLDERFSNIPAVTGEFNIQFYASANLKSYDGFNVGTLCVYDQQPRTLTDMQIDALAALSRQVSNLMELDRSLRNLQTHVDEVQSQKFLIEEGKLMLRAVLDSSTTYHVLLSRNLQILAFNKGVANYLKSALNKDIEKGVHITEYLQSENAERFNSSFSKALKGEIVHSEKLVKFGSERPSWWDLTFSPALNSFGDIIGVSFHAVNIDVRKQNELKVKYQNDILQKIAFIESHELRGPVSSIMGLMDIIRSDDYKTDPEHFELLENAVKQLDEKVQQVVQSTNELRIASR